jgi:hypothetical protein
MNKEISSWDKLIEEAGSEEELIKILKLPHIAPLVREAMRNNCKQDVLKIELKHKPYSSTGKDKFKIWWWNQYTHSNPNKLVYHYNGSYGVHKNITITEYIDVPEEFNKDNSEIKLIDNYVILTKINGKNKNS